MKGSKKKFTNLPIYSCILYRTVNYLSYVNACDSSCPPWNIRILHKDPTHFDKLKILFFLTLLFWGIICVWYVFSLKCCIFLHGENIQPCKNMVVYYTHTHTHHHHHTYFIDYIKCHCHSGCIDNQIYC